MVDFAFPFSPRDSKSNSVKISRVRVIPKMYRFFNLKKVVQYPFLIIKGVTSRATDV